MEPVKIEWDLDFDNKWLINLTRAFGREGPFRLKGRCRHCWGGLVGTSGPEDIPTAIRCRVCGILLEGSDAEEEYRGMSDEMSSHAFNMACEQPTKYREGGRFVCKVFPNIDRLPDDELRQRIDAKASKPAKRGWLTRNDFPPGSPGYLLLQAKTLMSALERLPREESVARFPDLDLHDDGSATLYWSKEQLSEHPSTTEYEMMKRLGSAMTVAMMSAFACELAMKAIQLTRSDETRKSHDLWQLYCDLPADCKKRIQEDYPDVVSVMERARHTFGHWRYFEVNIGNRGMSAMIDTDRALALSKSARVLLDEAEIMGLGYSVKLQARQRTTRIDDRRQHLHIMHDLYTDGTESPPR